MLSFPVFLTRRLTHSTPYSRFTTKALLCAGLVIFLLGIGATPAMAQNTKGDRPEVKYGGKSEKRFKFPRKKTKPKSVSNRVNPRRISPANSGRVAQGTKSNKNVYRRQQFVNNKSVSGRLSQQSSRSRSGGRERSVSSAVSRRNSQPGGRVSPRSVSSSYSKRNARSGGRVQARSISSSTRNIYPRTGRYVNNRSTLDARKSNEKGYSNRKQLARAKRFGTKQNPPNVRGKVTPASASRSYVTRKKLNPFAGYWNQKPKGEKAYKGDIAGRKLRTRNYQSPSMGVQTNPTTRPYTVKPRKTDQPYKGTMRSGHVSISSSGKAWKGDIAGRRVRGRNYVSKKGEVAGDRIFTPRSKSRRGERAYKGAMPTGGQRSMSARMKMGGGSATVRSTGGRWNNNGKAIAGRSVADRRVSGYGGNIRFGKKSLSPQGENYTGNIRARRPLNNGNRSMSAQMKMGGSAKAVRSMSGGWNNNGRAIAGRSIADRKVSGYSGNMRFGTKNLSPQGENYSGNIKARKPMNNGNRSISAQMKMGGSAKAVRSMSGGWNNNGRAIAGRYPGGDKAVSGYSGNIRFGRKSYAPQGEGYTGNIKAKRPVTNGNRSMSAQMKMTSPAKAVRSISGNWNNDGKAIQGRYPGGDRKVSWYSGTLKSRPKQKGGGSVSGELWNNNQQSVTKKNPGSTEQANFRGNVKLFDLVPSMQDQGETFTGHIKLSRFKRNYLKNPNAHDKALKKDRPHKTTYQVNDLQVNVKEKEYGTRPHAAKGALPGIVPGKSSIRASEYSKVMRQRWNYVRNPSSSDKALKVREPGKAFARATEYQGNIKMKKPGLFDKDERHPDARFVKINKNNTDEERSTLTNLKLWWARLFKKNDNQPKHLKEKVKKPRYDKGEDGLWYD